jgi:hypothetical protein
LTNNQRFVENDGMICSWRRVYPDNRHGVDGKRRGQEKPEDDG